MLSYRLMRRRIKKKTLYMAILALSISVDTYAYDNGDFQIWNTDYQNIKVAKNVKLAMEQEFRFGENATELYYQHYEWSAVFGFDKMLDIALGYRQVFDRYKQKWRAENMPTASATFKFSLWKFKLDDRNRIEYRHFRFKDDSARYRNKLTIMLPVDFKSIKVSPYSSDEIFITSDSTGFSENRFSSGIEFELTKYVKADLYYMLKSNKIKGDKWNNANVLGTKVKIAF